MKKELKSFFKTEIILVLVLLLFLGAAFILNFIRYIKAEERYKKGVEDSVSAITIFREAQRYLMDNYRENGEIKTSVIMDELVGKSYLTNYSEHEAEIKVKGDEPLVEYVVYNEVRYPSENSTHKEEAAFIRKMDLEYGGGSMADYYYNGIMSILVWYAADNYLKDCIAKGEEILENIGCEELYKKGWLKENIDAPEKIKIIVNKEEKRIEKVEAGETEYPHE
ncbi:MAG: hypothetical protein IJL89_10225 [Firmicutes bacterium]|nr:hypothetical protein [Bacillota bacterium]